MKSNINSIYSNEIQPFQPRDLTKIRQWNFLRLQTWAVADVRIGYFLALPGVGKTYTAALVFNHTHPSQKRLVFAAHRITARDRFEKMLSTKHVHIVRSNAEIISMLYPEHEKVIAKRIAAFYEAMDGFNDLSVIERLLADLGDILTDPVRNDRIRTAYAENAKPLHLGCTHLLLTTDKLKAILTYNRDDTLLADCAIFVDEVGAYELMPPTDKTYTVMGKDVSPYMLSKKERGWDFERIRSRQILFLTCESHIEKQFARADLTDYCKVVSQIQFDEPGLTVLKVKANGRVSGALTKLVKTVKGFGYMVGSNGHADAINISALKGMDDFAEGQFVAIANHPSPERIAVLMDDCGVTEEEAVSIAMSDDLLQSVGRVMGCRNQSGQSQCLLLVRAADWDKVKLPFKPGAVYSEVNWRKERDADNPFCAVIDAICHDTVARQQLALVHDSARKQAPVILDPSKLRELESRCTAGPVNYDEVKPMFGDVGERVLKRKLREAGFDVIEQKTKQTRFYWVK